MDEDLLTLEEAASIAHVSRETIRYWIKVKRISKHPAWISARSGKPYGIRVKRGELISSLTDTKVRRLEEEVGDRLLTVGEISTQIQKRPTTVRTMIRKLNPKRYYLHNNHEFVVSFREFLQLMQEDDWYSSDHYVYKIKHSDANHSCKFCIKM